MKALKLLPLVAILALAACKDEKKAEAPKDTPTPPAAAPAQPPVVPSPGSNPAPASPEQK